MEARVVALESVMALFLAQIDLECTIAGQTDDEALDTIKRIASPSSAFASEYAVVRESDGQLTLSRDARLRTVAVFPFLKEKKRKLADDAKWIPRMKPFDSPPPLEERRANTRKICKGNGKQ